MKEKDFEIMAPVGSYESLMAAIQGGADSIYFGIEGLNMRSRSSNNFTTEDLRKIVAICGEHGIKSYLTVNTVIYGEDLPLMREIIDAAKDAGVSAIIAADVAAMNYANSIGQEVHLSTQLNISNVEALKFYARFADVVVLARELNLKQVHEIYQEIVKQQIKGPKGELIRIEMFAHGALCMAVSGKCYLSLHEMNASANRGACMQICRRAYTVHDKDSQIELDVENQYIMSPKDLKTIHFMNKMMDAGVRVFKLEGRAKGSYYVACVTNAYRHVLDGDPVEPWLEELDLVSHRPDSPGFFLGKPTQNPGREEYARERRLVAVVESCERDGDGWSATVTCRNKVEAGGYATVLSPGEPPREVALGRDLVTNGESYRLQLPFEVAPLDVVCA